MDHKKLQAMAEELAKDLKTPDDLSQLSAFLTKLTVEAALKGEMNHHLGYHGAGSSLAFCLSQNTHYPIFKPLNIGGRYVTPYAIRVSQCLLPRYQSR